MSLVTFCRGLEKYLIIGVALLCSSAYAAEQIYVDDVRDLPDAVATDGKCETEYGTCTLRAALEHAAAGSDDHVGIELQPGHYMLTANASLALPCANLSLHGGSDHPSQTRIAAFHQNKIIDASNACVNNILSISNMTIANGSGEQGALLDIQRWQQLVVQDVIFENGVASLRGGALHIADTPTEILNTTFQDNSAAQGSDIAWAGKVDAGLSYVEFSASTPFHVATDAGDCEVELVQTELDSSALTAFNYAGCKLSYTFSDVNNTNKQSGAPIKVLAGQSGNLSALANNITATVDSNTAVWDLSRTADEYGICVYETGRTAADDVVYTVAVSFSEPSGTTIEYVDAETELVFDDSTPYVEGRATQCVLFTPLIGDGSDTTIYANLTLTVDSTTETVNFVGHDRIGLHFPSYAVEAAVLSEANTWEIFRIRDEIGMCVSESGRDASLTADELSYDIEVSFSEPSGANIEYTDTTMSFPALTGSNTQCIYFDPLIGDNSRETIIANIALTNVEGELTPSLVGHTQINIVLEPVVGLLSVQNRNISVDEDSGTAAVTFVRYADDSDTRKSPEVLAAEWAYLRGLPLTFQWGTEEANTTAESGDDFEYVAPTTASFSAGQQTLSQSVDLIDDVIVEPDEFFRVWFDNISEVANWKIADGNSKVTINIINDDEYVEMELVAPSVGQQKISVPESAGSVTIAVSRNGDLSTPFNTGIAFENGSAVAGMDFTVPVLNRTDFQPGSNRYEIVIPITDDNQYESDQSFTVQLHNPDGNVILGDVAELEVEIIDDDIATVEFSKPVFSAFEASGKGTVRLQRDGELAATSVAVAFSTTDGTARAGEDYLPIADQVVTFAAGEKFLNVDIQLLQDDVFEAGRDFTVSILPVGDRIEVGATSQATVEILAESDPRAQFQFKASNLEIVEGDAVFAEVIIERVGDVTAPARLVMSTADGTAVAGEDYTPVIQKVIVFDAGEMEVVELIEIRNDVRGEQTESFTVELVPHEENSATIVGTTSLTVVIQDNDGSDVERTASFTSNQYYVQAGVDQAVLQVIRPEAENISVTLEVTYVANTARVGEHFETDTQIVVIPRNQTTGELVIPLVPGRDTTAESTFSILLSKATPSDYKISAPSFISVVLLAAGEGVCGTDEEFVTETGQCQFIGDERPRPVSRPKPDAGAMGIPVLLILFGLGIWSRRLKTCVEHSRRGC